MTSFKIYNGFGKMAAGRSQQYLKFYNISSPLHMRL